MRTDHAIRVLFITRLTGMSQFFLFFLADWIWCNDLRSLFNKVVMKYSAGTTGVICNRGGCSCPVWCLCVVSSLCGFLDCVFKSDSWIYWVGLLDKKFCLIVRILFVAVCQEWVSISFLAAVTLFFCACKLLVSLYAKH